ncbi:nudix hydrolase 20, chloroplastic-like [Iris pallida]|uniref:Nudix hydrolase 20, chloroplastic-like n=1 Tax=Iris pallida TaxID=29817 RepID=A0AAX6I0M5_IRIPA|nr:nudix hydrolase 20, chloroplastic-like [Iris pallida]
MASYLPVASTPLLRFSSTARPLLLRHRFPMRPLPSPRRHVSVVSAESFGWDDVLRVAEEPRPDSSSDVLRGFLRRVRSCNRGSEFKSEFVPFLVENKVVGYIHKGFIDHLREFPDVFSIAFDKDAYNAGGHVMLHSSLRTPEERTEVVGDVIKNLGELIPGIRNEMYPVTSSFGMPTLFSLERAAAPYFGIKAYGVHMNGYVDRNKEKFLWVGKRSDMKPTYPGMLDHLVAGGLPHGISCQENLVKECEEEAGIPRNISDRAISVGAVSYMDIEDTVTKETFYSATI